MMESNIEKHGIILNYRVLNVEMDMVGFNDQVFKEKVDDFFEYNGRKYGIHIPIICQGFIIDYATGYKIFSLVFNQNETYHEVVDALVNGAIDRIDQNWGFNYTKIAIINS